MKLYKSNWTFTELELNTGRIFFLLKAMGISMVDVKADKPGSWHTNPTVQRPGSNSSIGELLMITYKGVTSIDENKNIVIERLPWGRVGTAIWMHYIDTNKTYGEKAWRQFHKNAASNIKQVLEATPRRAAAVRPPSITKTIQFRRTIHAGHCRRSKDELKKRYTPVDLFT